MATVERQVQLTVPDGCSLAELEGIIAEHLQELGRALMMAACTAVEEELLHDPAQRLKPNKRRARDLLTRFGWLRLERWSARDRETGQYRYPLDEALAMEPNQHASPWVMCKALALTERMSYREATALLAEVLGVDMDHRTVWGWVQEAARNSADGKTGPHARGGVVPIRATPNVREPDASVPLDGPAALEASSLTLRASPQ